MLDAELNMELMMLVWDPRSVDKWMFFCRRWSAFDTWWREAREIVRTSLLSLLAKSECLHSTSTSPNADTLPKEVVQRYHLCKGNSGAIELHNLNKKED